VVVNQRRSGAFEALADILRSPSLPHPVPLQDVWLSLPEGVTVPLQGTEEAWSAAKLKRADSRGFMAELATFPWDKNKVVATLSHLPYELAPLSVDEARRLLFQHYPDLKDFVPVWDEAGGTLKFGWHTDFRLSLDMAYWPRNYDHEFAVTGLDILYQGGINLTDVEDVFSWILPVIGGNTKTMHPLVMWWAVLYALSMLARYKPSNWTRMLDVDRSPDAPAIEYLLDEAHRVCINLIMGVFENRKEHAPAPPALREAQKTRRANLHRIEDERLKALGLDQLYIRADPPDIDA
jgi:hypothetical protein